MRITVGNDFIARCVGFENRRECDAYINHISPTGGLPGGIHLRIATRLDPPGHSHSFYFSQEDRIRIGLFLFAGVSLPEMTLKFDPKKQLDGLAGLVGPKSR
jgi:hypothetical protein